MKTISKNIIRVIIIEDEAHNSRMLKDMVIKLRPDWKVEAILESVQESVDWISNNAIPDLMLVDIELSDGTSFSIFKQVEIDLNCRIIFTTAYNEYAIRAFKVNSIDYLLKPIKEDELEIAFQKFEKLYTQTENTNQYSNEEIENFFKLANSIVERKKEYRKRFLISGITNLTKLEVKDVAYFYSTNKLTFAVDFEQKEHNLDFNLEQLEQELNPEHFFRANRKTIVNINSVVKLKRDHGGKLLLEISPSPNFEIVISRLKASDFKNWIGN